MVRVKNEVSEIRSTCLFKPGQALKNNKFSEFALILPKRDYEGLHDKANESERASLLAEREAKRLAALKEATYQMSKTWEDTAQNIQKRRREELLNRKKLEEAERIKFTKEMAIKKAEERAKVVKQAKELLLYRKPQCRRINRAILISDCFKELEEQLEYRKTRRSLQKNLKAEEAQSIRDDVDKFRVEEEQKHKKRLEKLKNYKSELEHQININERNLKNVEESIRKAEIEELKGMSEELEDISNKEMQQLMEKKEKLKKMFLDAIEEKKRQELKIKQEEEFQEKSLRLYQKFKQEVEKTMKERAEAGKESKIRRADILGKKFAELAQKKQRDIEKEDKKKEDVDKALEERSKKESLEQLEREKEKKIKARLEMQREMEKAEEESKLRKKEEMDLRLWETLQRYKRDEFNKEWIIKKSEEERKKKLNYGKILKKQMEQNAVERKKAAEEADDSKIIKELIDKENEKLLAFGKKVLEESRGVRPTYAIAKAVEEFKREVGLNSPQKAEKDYEVGDSVPRKKRGRRTGCRPEVKKDDAFYFA